MGDDDGLADGRESSLLSSVESAAARARLQRLRRSAHAIDLETGAIVGVTVQGADQGDTTTMQQTLPEAAAQLEAVAAVTDDAVKPIEEVVADKGYHSSR